MSREKKKPKQNKMKQAQNQQYQQNQQSQQPAGVVEPENQPYNTKQQGYGQNTKH